jgi:hypothetical protein
MAHILSLFIQGSDAILRIASKRIANEAANARVLDQLEVHE